MVFSDPAFLFYFLPLSLLTYWVGGWRVRNLYLLAISVIFYTSGGGVLILLVLGSSAFTYVVGLLVGSRQSRALVVSARAVGVGTLLVSLIIWKYLGFIIEQLSLLSSQIDVRVSLVLPIAISFYTFQCISYVIDVGRNDIPPARNPVDFLCYVTFFPQLIAGPVVRYRDVADQLASSPTKIWESFSAGAPRFFWGLAKKVLVVDQAGQLADAAFGIAGYQVSALDTLIGVLAYTVQIYFDFSGYSDMAIGLSRMFGIRFPENFRRPYSAGTVTDFWRRWHISLSSWFRDYVYIPLGGNRKGAHRTYGNLIVVFALTGFWHGANWTFLAWGMIHGAALIIERLLLRGPNRPRPLLKFPLRLWTITVVMFGWLLFRAVDLGHAREMLTSLDGRNGFAPSPLVDAALTTQRIFWGSIGLFALVGMSPISVGERLSSEERHPLLEVVAVAAGSLAALYVLSASFSPFLYFQF